MSVFLRHIARGRDVAEKLYRLYPYEVLHGMLFVNPLTLDDLKDRARLERFAGDLADQLPSDPREGMFFKVLVEPDPERSESRLVVERVQHGLTDRFVFGHQFFDGGDFAQIARAAGLLVGLWVVALAFLGGKKLWVF